MSFVEAFYTFYLEIVNTDEHRYAEVRVKTPKHPYEDAHFFQARALSYALSYEPELTFSQGLYEPSQPPIWKKDLLDNVVIWIEVGEVEMRRLHLAVRHSERAGTGAKFRVYFYSKEQIRKFCTELRGIKSNWICQIDFFLLSEDTIATLVECSHIRAHWSVTLSDGVLYLVVDGREITGKVEKVEIWTEYQRYLEMPHG